jgi:hypothetical protein
VGDIGEPLKQSAANRIEEVICVYLRDLRFLRMWVGGREFKI